MTLHYYGYDKCSTCRKARQWLDEHGVRYQVHDITTDPPSRRVLRQIATSGDYELKDLFNRSGVLYREMNIKEKVKTASADELLDLLAAHGRLIKRPILTDGKRHTVGFDPIRFKQTWT